LLATGQLKFCQITLYHYQTVILLAVISTVVHSLTMQVLRDFVLERPLLIFLRVGGMVIHVVLLFLSFTQSSGYILYPASCGSSILNRNYTALTLEIDHSHVSGPTTSRIFLGGILLSLYLIVFNFICLIITWSRKLGSRANVALPTLVTDNIGLIRRSLGPYRLFYIVGTSFIFNLLLALVLLIFASVLIFQLRGQVRPYLDGSEDDWGFGQIMPNLLLLISLFATLEAICEEVESGDKWYSWLLRLPHQTRQVEQRNEDPGEEMQARPPLRDVDQGNIHSQAVALRLEVDEVPLRCPRRNDTEARYDLADGDMERLLARNAGDMTMASSFRHSHDESYEDPISEHTLRVDAELGGIDAEANNGATGEPQNNGGPGYMILASRILTTPDGPPLLSQPTGSSSAAVHTVQAAGQSSSVNFQNTNNPPSRRTTFERDTADASAGRSSTIESQGLD
jgi:hypothetical protein